MTTEGLQQEEARVARLARHTFTRGLSHRHLVLLADSAITTRFRPGEKIFRAGERADRFYLIESGEVVLESGSDRSKPVVIQTIGAGDVLGWSWMMPPYQWQFTARATQPTEALHFLGSILHEYCERDHSLGFELHKRMSAVMMKRLQAARRKMVSINAERERLEPASALPPLLEQDFDRNDSCAKGFREEAD